MACKVRMGIVESTYNAKCGHPGGSLSAADMFTYLYFKELNVDPANPKWAAPPVCRVIDFQKFLYQQKKRAKEQKAKAAKVEIKEIRFGPQTDDHDYNFKLKHAMEFLKEGAKVKAYVFFKGRSILFKEQGEVLLLRFVNDLEEYGKLEQMPRLEGKRMIIMLSPKKK